MVICAINALWLKLCITSLLSFIMDGPCSHVNSSGCHCSSKPSSCAQSLTEMDFERGIWQAALDGDVKRVKSLLDKGGDPDARDGSGYTALVNITEC